jgi:hypothetical protein
LTCLLGLPRWRVVLGNRNRSHLVGGAALDSLLDLFAVDAPVLA